MNRFFFIFIILSGINFAPLYGMEMESAKTIIVKALDPTFAVKQQRDKLTDVLEGGIKVSKFTILTGSLAELINDYEKKQTRELTIKLSEYQQRIITSTNEQISTIAESCVENLLSAQSWKNINQVYEQLLEKKQELSEETSNNLMLEARPILKAVALIANKLKPFQEEEEKLRTEFKKEFGFDPELFGKNTEMTPKIYISSLDDEMVSEYCKLLHL